MKKALIEDIYKYKSFIESIRINDTEALEMYLKIGKNLHLEDLTSTFYDETSSERVGNVDPKILEMLYRYKALPKEVTFSTLKFVLYAMGHDRINIEATLQANYIDFKGWEGLQCPMIIADKYYTPNFNNPPDFSGYKNVLSLRKEIEEKFFNINVVNKLEIMKWLLTHNHTVQVDEIMHTFKNPLEKWYYFRAFFSWLAMKKEHEIFSSKEFIKIAENFPGAFEYTSLIAPTFSSREFIKRGIELHLYSSNCINIILNTITARNDTALVYFMGDICKKQGIILKEDSYCSYSKPINYAIKSCKPDIVTALIKCGFYSVNQRYDSLNNTCLGFSIGEGDRAIKCTSSILSCGANIEENIGFDTPLYQSYNMKQPAYNTALLLVLSCANTIVLPKEQRAELRKRFLNFIENFSSEIYNKEFFLTIYEASHLNKDIMSRILSFLKPQDLCLFISASKPLKSILHSSLTSCITKQAISQ